MKTLVTASSFTREEFPIDEYHKPAEAIFAMWGPNGLQVVFREEADPLDVVEMIRRELAGAAARRSELA